MRYKNCIAENFRGENIRKFSGITAFRKSFSSNFVHIHVCVDQLVHVVDNLRKFSPRNAIFLPKFSPANVSSYTVFY